jgi:alpha-amylase
MGSDLDMTNDAVKDDLKRWGEWVMDTTGCAGFRLDAVKVLLRGQCRLCCH